MIARVASTTRQSPGSVPPTGHLAGSRQKTSMERTHRDGLATGLLRSSVLLSSESMCETLRPPPPVLEEAEDDGAP